MTEIIPIEQSITSRDGTQLRAWSWTGDMPIRGHLVIIHGFAEHASRYAHVARRYVDLGYRCVTGDVRGHGHSEGPRGYIERYDQYVDDAQAIVEAAFATREDDRPVFLVGHSQGGLVVTRFVQQRSAAERLAGLVLFSPFLGLAQKVPVVKGLLGNAMSRILPGLAMESGIDPHHLSHDEAVVASYAADPLVFTKARSRWFTETVANHKLALEEAGRITLPCLVLHGLDDHVVSPDATRRLFPEIGSSDKTLELFDGLRHELFNELRKDEVFVVVDQWLNNHTP